MNSCGGASTIELRSFNGGMNTQLILLLTVRYFQVESGTKHVWFPLSFSGRNSTSTIPREIRSFRYSSPSQDEPGQEKRKSNPLYQHRVRIHYDATRIGSRTVFEYYQRLGSGQNLRLAPPETSTSLGMYCTTIAPPQAV